MHIPGPKDFRVPFPNHRSPPRASKCLFAVEYIDLAESEMLLAVQSLQPNPAFVNHLRNGF